MARDIQDYSALFAVGNEYGFVLDLREHMVLRRGSLSYVFLSDANLYQVFKSAGRPEEVTERLFMQMSAFCFNRQSQSFLKTRFALNGDHFSGMLNNLK